MAARKYRPHPSHWFVAKAGAQRDSWDSGMEVPPGMLWIVIPPHNHCLSPEVEWFPSGEMAFQYLIDMKGAK
ncbi:Uncharacterised protein [Mycobacteroides abscessus subsp. abscessus]|nr:Uncharacterised protein [Mycobacteroides abscessus subsp. abscessus]SKL81240.1 Uncharacterised protein [Mycobacteroides abscessus subsp. abscessus]SKM52459.1 Uncharacterised protein [Mycobacteroides abscessus subsp. abscessus]SLK34451.1 Uncharacterised protein [Mycobacteroides abscessus subsp. abscessus]